MTVSIDELRRLTKKKKGHHNLYTRMARNVSIYVTWLLIHTSITANQTTVLSAIVGIAGALLFLFASPIYWAVGFLLIQGYQILDCVDGEIARYRKASSEYGKYLEHVSGMAINFSVFFFSTIGLYLVFKDVLVLVLGLAASFSKLSFPYVKEYDPKSDNVIVAVSREIGGFFQFIIMPIVLDFVFGVAYFRTLFIMACGIVFPLLFVWRFMQKKS